ncbi:MAG: sensor histidine kinase, partial [Huintestinicola sp.]
MIKTLQKKFIITAMTAISVLLILLLGAINVANIVSVSRETEKNINVISESEGEFGKLKPVADARRPEMPQNFRGGEKNAYDTFMSSNFFVVRFNANGEEIKTDVSRTSTVSEDEALQLANQVVNSEKTEGKTGKYRFKITISADGEIVAVFLDTSNEIVSYLRVLALSALIGLVCWGLMLIFVILLSKKAIRPIAENIDRQKQFITNAGHEIKTPVAIIQANTEAMELYNGESKWSKNIKTQTARLSGLMNDLLFLARMDENSVSNNASEFCVSELLQNSINGFAQSVENAEAELISDIAPDIVMNADKMQIEQLFSVMLDNAVKYVSRGGIIRIVLKQSERHIKAEFFNTCDELP